MGSRLRGFTLLEVLVVVLIVGIIISFATLAIRDNPEQRLQTEGDRFVALVRLASQEAVLQSREVAVVFERGGYHFEVLDQGQWVRSQDNVFRARTLPDGMTLSVQIEGDRLGLEADREDARSGREPRIFLLSGGEMTPFEVEFLDTTQRRLSRRVSGDFGGRLTIDD